MVGQGTLVGAYRIESLLGRGGMGAVYRARHVESDRLVALKVLADQLRADPDFVARFRREGVTQASLEHPHVVTVYDAGDSEHGLFLAMRLIEGSTLAALIASHELGVRRALQLLAQVADALDAAHAAGLVHRDVKPANVLIGGDDHAYLADFGLTRSGAASDLTRTGVILGTFAYMAPEVVRGENPGPAADRYAFAAMAFECLTGGVVFPRATQDAILFAHASEPPPRLSGRRPELGEELDDLFATALAKEPDERPATARGFVDAAGAAIVRNDAGDLGPPTPAGVAALTAFSTAEPVPAAAVPVPAVPARSRRPIVGAALAGVAGAAVVGVAWALTGSGEDGKQTVAVADPPGLTMLGAPLDRAGRTLGCDGRPAGRSSPECTIVQSELPGATLVVPENGVIRRWTVRAARGELALVVLRPRGAGSFQVATTQLEQTGNAEVETFASELSVDRGDLVGLRIAPASGVGVREDVTGAATERWIPDLIGTSRAADKPAGTGFDHEVLLRVGLARGATARGPAQVTGARAQALAEGSALETRRVRLGSRDAEVALVAVGDRMALDEFVDGERVARIDIPDVRRRGLVLDFEVDGGDEIGVSLEYRNIGSDRVVEHGYSADARGFVVER